MAPFNSDVQAQLNKAVEAAKAAYESAKTQYAISVHSGEITAIERAANEKNDAFWNYHRVLGEFSAFILHDKLPDSR